MKKPASPNRAPMSAQTPSELARAIPRENVPSPDQRTQNHHAEIYTYFAKPGETRRVYTGDRPWAIVTLTLETAGPVAVSTKQTITPVLSGKGALLRTGVPVAFTLARGDSLWIAATSVNRVSVSVTEAAWQEQILGGTVRGHDVVYKATVAGFDKLAAGFDKLAGAIAGLVRR